MWRPIRIVLIACALLVASIGPASATAQNRPAHRDIASIAALSALWYRVLTLPSPENPFGTGGAAKACVSITPSLLSPFGSGPELTCTVNRGTSLVVTPWTSECSTFEDPPFHGDTPSELRECAKEVDAGITSVSLTVDGRVVRTDEVETVLLNVTLPADNIFPLYTGPRKGQSVGHGWVAVLRPMTPGKHVIHLTADGTYYGDIDNTTTIIVRRH